MGENLEAIRVKLLNWQLEDDQKLVLNFEKAAPYLWSKSFTKPGNPVTVFTDFGYVRLTLFGVKLGGDWLNEYIDDDEVFIEEEDAGCITIWEGSEEDRYDWQSSYSIDFDEKKVEFLPLTNEDWASKYEQIVRDYEVLRNERYDIIHNDLLKLFIEVTKGMIQTTLPEQKSVEMNRFRQSISNNLDSWLRGFEERRREMDEALTEPQIELPEDEEPQEYINREVKSFWTRLKERFNL